MSRKTSKSTAATAAADALTASHGTDALTAATNAAPESTVTKPATAATPKPRKTPKVINVKWVTDAAAAQGALALVTPSTEAVPVDVALHNARASDASFDPTFIVGGVTVGVEALTVGTQGVCHPDALFVPPQGHSRHDPRAFIDRGPEFDADIAANGIEQPVAVYVLDGRVEVKDGRGRHGSARKCGRDVPFIVTAPPSDALAARMSASRLNTLRLPVDPVAQGGLFTEALDAGLSVKDIAAAMGVPESRVSRLARVAVQADDATKALLSDGVITDGAALTITQQTPEARADIVAGVEALVAAAAASPEGKVATVTGSRNGDARKDKTSKRGVAVTQSAVEALRDAAKGKPVTQGGKDSAKPKPASDGVARPDPKRDREGERDLRLAKVRRNALATLASGTASESERAYAQGLLDAVAYVYTGTAPEPVAGHPFPSLAVALVRFPAGHDDGVALAKRVGQ